MKKEDIRFEIDQLRKERIIDAVEALVVLGLSICIGILLSSGFINNAFFSNALIFPISVSIGICIVILLGVKSITAYFKVKRLEKKIKD